MECSSDKKENNKTNGGGKKKKTGNNFAVFRRQEEHIKKKLLRIYSRFLAMIFFFFVHCVKLLRGRTSFVFITGPEFHRRSKSFNRHILFSNTFFFPPFVTTYVPYFTWLFLKHKNVLSKNEMWALKQKPRGGSVGLNLNPFT